MSEQEDRVEQDATHRWVEDMAALWAELYDLYEAAYPQGVSDYMKHLNADVMAQVPHYLAMENNEETLVETMNYIAEESFKQAVLHPRHLSVMLVASGGWLCRCVAQLTKREIKAASVSGRECLSLITAGMQLLGVPMTHVKDTFEDHNTEYRQRIAAENARPKQ